MGGFLDYLLTQMWEELLLVLLLWLPLLVLAALCLLTLDKLPPQQRRGLFALFFTMLGLAAVLFGGAAALGQYGLAWRTWFQEGMSAVLWLAGLTTGLLSIVYAGRWLAQRGSGMKGVVMGLSAFCLASAMFVGTVMGGLWAMGPGEQVVTYAGRKAILGTWTWMERSYELYEYRGPLVRGAAPRVDWDWSLLEGAVINGG